MSGVQYFSNRWKTRLHIVAFALFFLASAPAWSFDEITTPAAPETAATENSAPAATSNPGRVARAIFTTAIVDREPVDELESLPNSTNRVYFFSDLRELAGEIVTHRWKYNEQVMAEITFKVGAGTRWRVYSSKNLLPEWTGTWTVMVSNASGQVLQTSSFDYVQAAAAQQAPAQ